MLSFHALQPPVTCTFTSGSWHEILRQLVYAASAVERTVENARTSLDPRRDAYALALLPVLQEAVRAVDRAVEVLSEAQARPVPSQTP